jgi:hypothetical protein
LCNRSATRSLAVAPAFGGVTDENGERRRVEIVPCRTNSSVCDRTQAAHLRAPRRCAAGTTLAWANRASKELAPMDWSATEHYVQVVYFRPSASGCTALDGRIIDLVEQHRDGAGLIIEHTDDAGVAYGSFVSGRVPTVLFVVDGVAVAQAVGDVPRLELQHLMRSALRAVRPARREPLRRSA